MKAYFVTSENIGNLQTALGKMIEYAKFLAKESGSQERMEFVDTLLKQCDIHVDEVEL